MRVRRGAAMCLALGLTLGACSDGDEPATLPEVTPDGSPTTSVPSPPATPTGDPTADLEAEITAFYKEYVQTINESWTSPEALDRRREMFADTCISCLASYEWAERAHAEAMSLEGGQAAINRVQLDRVDGDVVTVSAFTSSEAGRLVDSAGSLVQQFEPSSDVQIAYQLRRSDRDGWMIILGEVLS